MRKVKILLPVLLCTVLLLGCFALPFGQVTPETALTTQPVTVAVTHPETQPAETQPPETTATIPPTEGLHSPLYQSDLPVEDVIRYFNEVCLGAEFVNSGDPSLVQKWAAPILYKVHGEPTQEDLEVLSAFSLRLNLIPGFPGIYETPEEDGANMDIFFCSEEELLTRMGNNFYNTDGGVTFWYQNNEIHTAIICVRTDIDQYTRNSVIMEELYNGLGPVQDTDLRNDSIIYAGFSQPQELTSTDWLILELLYHPDMKCGMGIRECETIIRDLYY